MANFRLHQAEFGRVSLIRRLAQISFQRGEQGGFIPFQSGGKNFGVASHPNSSLRVTPVWKKGAMALDGWRSKTHQSAW